MRRHRRFEITYSVVVPSLPKGVQKIELWAPFPRATTHQEVHDVEVKTSMGYEVQYDPVFGNKFLHATANGGIHERLELVIRTQATRYERSVKVTHVKSSAVPVSTGSSPFRAQLDENKLIRFSPDILEIATRIKSAAKSTLDIARAAYQHVLESMSYDKTTDGWGHGDAQFACSMGKGNCTDFHSLFLAIVRACNIPGQFEIGFAFPTAVTGGDITSYKCGYHCWASFYVPVLGWVPVDCSEAVQKPSLHEYYFSNLDENRFLLSCGRDIELPGRKGRDPVNFFTEPVIETQDGVRIPYEKTLTFRNL